MGSSCQKWGNCRTYEATTDQQAVRNNKSKHFKRFGRTNTVVMSSVNQEEIKQGKDSEINVNK